MIRIVFELKSIRNLKNEWVIIKHFCPFSPTPDTKRGESVLIPSFFAEDGPQYFYLFSTLTWQHVVKSPLASMEGMGNDGVVNEAGDVDDDGEWLLFDNNDVWSWLRSKLAGGILNLTGNWELIERKRYFATIQIVSIWRFSYFCV